MAGIKLKPVRVIGAVGVIAAMGYGGFILLPDIGNRLHQEDVRESAQQAGAPQQAAAPSKDDLDCGSDGAKKLVDQVVRKNTPFALITNANNNSQDALFQSCMVKLEHASDTETACYAAADPPYANCIADPNMGAAYLGDARAKACMAAEQTCNDAYQSVVQESKTCRAAISTSLIANVSYSVENIRLESRNPTTGAVQCNVTLHVELPNGPKSFVADEEVSYKLEKMEDGGLHIDMTGLQ